MCSPGSNIYPDGSGAPLWEGTRFGANPRLSSSTYRSIHKGGSNLPSFSANYQPQSQVQVLENPRLDSPSQHSSVEDVDSWRGEEDQGDPEFSDNEGVLPDRPAFMGLFCPSVFKSLLHKAKVTTNMGVDETPIDQSQRALNPHGDLFSVSTPDQEFIPCLQLFTEVIQKQ